jgi:hypothetical protein
MALGRASPGRSAILVALALHYLLLTSVLPALHMCEHHAHAEPCHDDALAVRDFHADEDHGRDDCVACQFFLLPKTVHSHAILRAPTVPLRVGTLVGTNDLPSSVHLLICVLPRGPPAQARA